MKEQELHPPSAFEPQLTREVLSFFANQMLEIYYDVYATLITPNDTNYTRGCTLFGRIHECFTRQIIRNLCPVPVFLEDGTFKFIFQIGSARIRFLVDDFINPKKKGFFIQSNPHFQLFPSDENEPVIWRFILDEPKNDEDEAKVIFAGYNSGGNVVAYWDSDDLEHNKLHLVDPITPESIELNAPFIEDPDLDDLENEDLDTKFK